MRTTVTLDDQLLARAAEATGTTERSALLHDGLKALIEREAGDERNFVKKAVNMALRAIGKRNRALNAAATVVARRLANSKDATARWVGKDALRELTSPTVTRRVTASRRAPD
jgi:3-methyladenine DNA glycosylase AlkD